MYLAVILAATLPATGQEIRSIPSPAPLVGTSIKTPSATQLKGLALLDAAEIDAKSLPPSLRAYTLARVATGRAQFDRDKGVAAFVAAFEATKGIEEYQDRVALQRDILLRLQAFSFAGLEQLFWQAEPEGKLPYATTLLRQKMQSRDYQGALDIAREMKTSEGFAIEILVPLLQGLPQSMDAERDRLFREAMEFGRTPQKAPSRFGLFQSLVMSTWQNLPRQTALEAVDMLLDQAKSRRSSVTTYDRFGNKLEFSSAYEHRAYELFTILRKLDPTRTEALLKDSPTLRAAVEIRVEAESKARASAPHSERTDGTPSPLQRMADLRKLAETDSGAALSMARDFPESRRPGDRYPDRMEALYEVALRSGTQSPEVTQSALDAMAKLSPELGLEARQRYVEMALSLSNRLKDEIRARSLIDVGLKNAEELYRVDIDSNDPNQAAKAFWPSTAQWQTVAFYQMKYAPDAVAGMIRRIPDQDVRALVSASAALGLVQDYGIAIASSIKKKERTIPAPRTL